MLATTIPGLNFLYWPISKKFLLFRRIGKQAFYLNTASSILSLEGADGMLSLFPFQ